MDTTSYSEILKKMQEAREELSRRAEQASQAVYARAGLDPKTGKVITPPQEA
jgi:hypothetical protein